jgi:anti-anti-sigma factor
MARARELHALALETARDSGESAVFDCSTVERIDAAGAQVLIALSRALEARGSKLELVGLSEGVCGLLTTAGLAGALRIGRDANGGSDRVGVEGGDGAAVHQDGKRDEEKEQVERA